MIRTVFFDLDETLFDFKRSEKTALSKTLIALGENVTEEILKRYGEINLYQWKLLEKGETTRQRLKIERFSSLFKEFGINKPFDKTAEIYEKFLSGEGTLFEGTESLLEKLYEKYDLYIVSNGTAAVQRGRLESSGIKKYFKNIFISENIGFNKPDKEFFGACFAEISGFKKENAVIIGDSLSADVRGGLNAGIKTIWFNSCKKDNNGDTVPDFTVYSLAEIPSVLENI